MLTLALIEQRAYKGKEDREELRTGCQKLHKRTLGLAGQKVHVDYFCKIDLLFTIACLEQVLFFLQ